MKFCWSCYSYENKHIYLLRPINTRDFAPGACSRGTLREQSSSLCINDFMGILHPWVQNFHPAKCSTTFNRLNIWEQASGANWANLKMLPRMYWHVQNEPGACSESKTPRVYRPLRAYYLTTLTPPLGPLKVNKHPGRLLCGFRKYPCNPQEGQRKKRHFRVQKTGTFKWGQPFLWKWVLFAWEWKIIYLSKAEHLTSFWYRGRRENSEMAYSQGRGVQMEAISEGMGGKWLFEVFFPGRVITLR